VMEAREQEEMGLKISKASSAMSWGEWARTGHLNPTFRRCVFVHHRYVRFFGHRYASQ
jgi:hypothetical protein